MAILKFECNSCGEDYARNVYDTNDSSQTKQYWRNLQGKPNGLCADCYSAKKRTEWEEKNQQATQQAEKQGLPELQRSEKQVAWANNIRQKRIDDLQEEIECFISTEEDIAIYQKALKIILSKTEAKWFIDHRNGGAIWLANRLTKEEKK